MSVLVGDCVEITIPEANIKVVLEVEKIENDNVYFGKCINGIIDKSDIVLEKGNIIEENSIIEGLIYWREQDEMYPLRFKVNNVDDCSIYLKSCESSLPLKFLTDSSDIKIVKRK